MEKVKNQVGTIDCTLITVTIGEGETATEFALDTASKIAVETQIETTEAVKLIVKGILRAQKRKKDTVTGTTITLTDNLFTPDLVVALQGGVLEYDTTDPEKVKKYTPPVVGDDAMLDVFALNAYSAVQDAAGNTVEYEKITYPNCVGQPIAFNSEDNVFRVAEYIINSAPNTGQAPYILEYVATLPV